MLTKKQILLFLAIIATLEAISQTFWQAYGDKNIAAILYVISGMLIGVLPLLKTKTEPEKEQKSHPVLYHTLAMFVAIFIACFGWQAIQKQPLDYTFADMLPIIEVMGQRFLQGQEVYAAIPEIWEGMQPIYLPAMWMPYTTAIAFGIDIRWVNLLFVFLAMILALDVFNRKREVDKHRYLLYLPIAVLLAYVLVDYSTFITISEEPMVVGFYAFLAYYLVKNKPYRIGIAIACCMLSRYALVFWAITYVVYTFWSGKKREALIMTITASGVGLFLMFISQGIYQLDLFYGLKDSYLVNLTDPTREWSIVNVAEKNIGLARFIAYKNLPVLHRSLFLGSMILPVTLYIWYHFKLKDYIPAALFALCSLKLCLVYFFNMNALPYSYLFYTSTFLSLIIVGHYQLLPVFNTDGMKNL